MSLMFRASRFCIQASQTGKVLARWTGGSKALMLSPGRDFLTSTGRHMPYLIVSDDNGLTNIGIWAFLKN